MTGRPTARERAWRWGPAIAWMGLIFVLSAQPGLKVSSDASVDGPIRHLAHIGVYGVLSALLVHGLVGLGRPVTVRVALAAFGLGVLYGVSDEIHQAFVPDRTGTLIDVGYDALGAALGVAAAGLLGRLRRPRRDSPPAPGAGHPSPRG